MATGTRELLRTSFALASLATRLTPKRRLRHAIGTLFNRGIRRSMQNRSGASRRDILLGAVAAGVTLPIGSVARAAVRRTAYHSTLVNGYTPSYPLGWADLADWKVAAGSTWNAGMDHSVQMSGRARKIRFEIRNTERDRPKGDEPKKRRSEIKGSNHVLPNDVPIWGAFSFIHHPWADPVGMAKLYGGVHGQIHIGSKFGGSPAVAFRRHKTGDFLITTRGQFNTANSKRYRAPLAFGKVHDIVYRVLLHPTAGELTVWLNGVEIVDIRRQSIGATTAECYWQLGAYYSGGITCPIVAEYANHVYPLAGDLSSRITRRPAWPVD